MTDPRLPDDFRQHLVDKGAPRRAILVPGVCQLQLRGDDVVRVEAGRLVEKLVRLASSGRMLGLEHNPWNLKFLPDKSGTPAKTLPEKEAKKLPADAEQTLAKWLQIAPMQPTVWAVLGQILFVRGDPSDALECFKRAKAMGYNSPLIAEYIRLLEREEAARRSAVMSGMNTGAAMPTTTPDSAPVAMTGSSSRAIAVFGFGGLVVGFLIGVMASKRK